MPSLVPLEHSLKVENARLLRHREREDEDLDVRPGELLYDDAWVTMLDDLLLERIESLVRLLAIIVLEFVVQDGLRQVIVL